MKHGSLFSGIGGFDLAAEWMGWENIFHCEINEFCQKVLKHHFPKSISYEDIKTTDFSVHRGKVDIISGGFPCQPFSVAGKRKGNEDDRYLWKEMLRAIREVQPSWVVGENVLGIVNWNGGMVFEQVQADLEAEGYKSQAYVLPACAINATHRRERTWFVAYSDKCNDSRRTTEYEKESKEEQVQVQERNEMEQSVVATDLWVSSNANTKRLSRSINKNGSRGQSGQVQESIKKFHPRFIANSYYDLSEPYTVGRNDGLSEGLVGITFSKLLIESIKAYGNAVVPHLVFEIYKTIEQYEKIKNDIT